MQMLSNEVETARPPQPAAAAAPRNGARYGDSPRLRALHARCRFAAAEGARGHLDLELCRVLETLVAIEQGFGHRLGDSGVRKLREAAEAVGVVFCAHVLSRTAAEGIGTDG